MARAAKKEAIQRNVSLLDPLSTTFNDPQYADLTVQCGSSTWKLHKVIVCTASAFFRGAMNADMTEKSTGVINLPGDQGIVSEMLKFMYSGAYTSPSEANLTKTSTTQSKGKDLKSLEDLLFHVKMFAIADEYLVAALKVDASRRFEELCSKLNRKKGYVEALCDAIKLTEELVPQVSGDSLRNIQVKEIRRILVVQVKESQLIVRLLEEAPHFGSLLAIDIARKSLKEDFMAPFITLNCDLTSIEKHWGHLCLLSKDDYFNDNNKRSKAYYCPICLHDNQIHVPMRSN